jgi:hypothetical protein
MPAPAKAGVADRPRARRARKDKVAVGGVLDADDGRQRVRAGEATLTWKGAATRVDDAVGVGTDIRLGGDVPVGEIGRGDDRRAAAGGDARGRVDLDDAVQRVVLERLGVVLAGVGA